MKHTYKITSTFYSDGVRQITVQWDSVEGERETITKLNDLIEEFLKSEGYENKD